MEKLSCAAGLLLVALMISCTKEINEHGLDTSVTNSSVSLYNEGRVLVQFKSGVSAEKRSGLLALVGGSVTEHVFTAAMKQAGEEGFFVVQVKTSVEEAIQKLQLSPHISSVEPDYLLQQMPVQLSDDPSTTYRSFQNAVSSAFLSTNNDPLYSLQWNMHGAASGQPFGINADGAWSVGYTGSAAVHVAMIGFGVDVTHEELSGNIWTNPAESTGATSVDDDGNGYIDDIYGWNFTDNNNNVAGPGDHIHDPHGTRLSSIVGAEGNNGKGIAGVCWDVTLIPVRVQGGPTTSTSTIVKALDYVTNLKSIYNLNLVASVNDWEAGKSTQVQAAIERANKAGILMVCATGGPNTSGATGINLDKKTVYPACYPNNNIIVVCGIKRDGSLPSDANYGQKSVDIAAPAQDVITAIPPTANDYDDRPGDGYLSYFSNSTFQKLSAAHVAGAIALYASKNNLAPKTAETAAQVKSVILNSAVPVPALSGKCATGGRLDVYNALSNY